MTTKQEPKYKIENGKLCNRQTGVPIPDDEPVFILRGKDNLAVDALEQYLELAQECSNSDHEEAVQRRLEQFRYFAEKNPDRMKEPDTILTSDWDNL